MPRTVYDTRFLIEHYYSDSEETLRKTREELRKARGKCISTIVIHEVYQLTLKREGREVAILRTSLLEKDFRVVNVDSEIEALS